MRLSGREGPLWILEPSAACQPLLPQPWSPSARLGSVGPCLVPMSLSSSSLTSSTWRKTGSWALPGIGTHPSSGLGCKDAVMVGDSRGGTWDRVWGRGSAGQARVARASLPCLRAWLHRLCLLWPGLLSVPPTPLPGACRTQQ